MCDFSFLNWNKSILIKKNNSNHKIANISWFCVVLSEQVNFCFQCNVVGVLCKLVFLRVMLFELYVNE